MPKSAKVTWLQAPADHDFLAAQSFLRLVATPPQVAAISESLSQVPTVLQRAKDILKATIATPWVTMDWSRLGCSGDHYCCRARRDRGFRGCCTFRVDVGRESLTSNRFER